MLIVATEGKYRGNIQEKGKLTVFACCEKVKNVEAKLLVSHGKLFQECTRREKRKEKLKKEVEIACSI